MSGGLAPRGRRINIETKRKWYVHIQSSFHLTPSQYFSRRDWGFWRINIWLTCLEQQDWKIFPPQNIRSMYHLSNTAKMASFLSPNQATVPTTHSLPPLSAPSPKHLTHTLIKCRTSPAGAKKPSSSPSLPRLI